MNVKVLLLLLFFAGCLVALGFIFGPFRGGEAELTNSDASDNGDDQRVGDAGVAESAENVVTPVEAAGGDARGVGDAGVVDSVENVANPPVVESVAGDARGVGDAGVAGSAESAVNPPVAEEVSGDAGGAGNAGKGVVDSVENVATPAEAAGGDDQRVGDAGVAGSTESAKTPVEEVSGDARGVGEAGKGVVGSTETATNVEQGSDAGPGSGTLPDAGAGNLRGDGATTSSDSPEAVPESPKSPEGNTTGDAGSTEESRRAKFSGKNELGLLSGMAKTVVNYVKPGITEPDANDELNILGKGVEAVFTTFLGTNDAKNPEVPKAAESTVQQGSQSAEQGASSQQPSQESHSTVTVASSQEQPQGSRSTNEGASSTEQQGSQSTEQGASSQQPSQEPQSSEQGTSSQEGSES